MGESYLSPDLQGDQFAEKKHSLIFCNLSLENEFRTNFNPMFWPYAKVWIEFVKIGNKIRFFSILN